MRDLLLLAGGILGLFSFCLYSYLGVQNRLTELKIRLPELEREILLLGEENQKLAYEAKECSTPARLIEKASLPEFAHLRHPLLQEVVTVQETVVASNE
ncbi:MAG: hypothetical protein KGI80_05920 [Verrucomicrobiota bacterium]|nr:hypothetical protein [Verrucomicrobiota bacterium]